MILTTEQQAYNFALYALESDHTLEGLNYECLIGALKSIITLVFGICTFTAGQLDFITEKAVATADKAA